MLRLIFAALAVLFFVCACSGTSDGHRNEGKWVMLACAFLWALLAILAPQLHALWHVPYGKLLLFVQLPVLVFLLAAVFPAVYGLFRRAKTPVQLLIVPGTALIGTEPSPLLEGRLRGALRCLEQNAACTVLVSGGQVNDEAEPEAIAMKDWLIRHGIPENRILTEAESRTTLENFRFSADLLRARGIAAENAAICTDRFHYFRCERFAGFAGLSGLCFVPAVENPLRAAPWYFREVLVWIKFAIEGIS